MNSVNLYYLGGLPDNAIITARGRVFTVPAPGQYLQVPSVYVKPLMDRNPNVFTTNPGVAAKAQQEMHRQTVVAQTIEVLPEELTKEQLLELLSRLDDSVPEVVKESPMEADRRQRKKALELAEKDSE